MGRNGRDETVTGRNDHKSFDISLILLVKTTRLQLTLKIYDVIIHLSHHRSLGLQGLWINKNQVVSILPAICDNVLAFKSSNTVPLRTQLRSSNKL